MIDRPARRLGLAAGTSNLVIAFALLSLVLTVLLMLALSTAHGGHALSAGRAGRIAITIADPDPVSRDRATNQAVLGLRGIDGVEAVRIVPAAEAARLVRPWIGPDEIAEGLLPALVEIQAKTIDDRLRSAIGRAAPGAHIDEESAALAPIIGALRAVTIHAAALALASLVSLAGLALFAGRAAVGGQVARIGLLRMLGGTDDRIAGLLGRGIGMAGLIGGGIGLGAGLATGLLLSSGARSLDSGVVAALSVPPLGWLALLVLPGAIGSIAWFAASLACRRALRHLP